MDLERLYHRLPVPLQNAAVSLEGWRLLRRRYGQEYRSLAQRVAGRERLSGDALLDYQRQRLAELLAAAAATEFWSERFRAHGVNPTAGDPFVELAKLPVLTKDDVKRHAPTIRNPRIPTSELLQAHTSGTTGSGLIFWQTRQAELEQWAIWWRYRAWHGISPTAWCGYFGGRSLVPAEQTAPPYWRINWPGRQLMLSIGHLTPETAAAYVAALRRYRVEWLHGYPSFLSLLSSLIVEQGLQPPPVRVITTGAESLLPHQRDVVTRAFKAPVHEHYGQAEAVANISECDLGQLHVDEDFSFVELVPHEDADGALHIVGSNWSNLGFPLLRYGTGDLARVDEANCPCGRGGRVVRDIDGRKEDYVVLASGARVGRLDHIFKDLVWIREAQIYQRNVGHIRIDVVKGDGYDREAGEATLVREARRRLGPDVQIDIAYVDQVARSRTGKLRLVVSEVGSINSAQCPAAPHTQLKPHG